MYERPPFIHPSIHPPFVGPGWWRNLENWASLTTASWVTKWNRRSWAIRKNSPPTKVVFFWRVYALLGSCGRYQRVSLCTIFSDMFRRWCVFFCGPTASVLVAWLWPRITGPGDLLSWIVDTTETFLALFKRPEKKPCVSAKVFLGTKNHWRFTVRKNHSRFTDRKSFSVRFKSQIHTS